MSGQPVTRFSRDQGQFGDHSSEVATCLLNSVFNSHLLVSLSGGEGGEEVANEPSPALKRNNSALNVAKLLKKTLTKHNLHAPATESPEAQVSKQQTELNGHASAPHATTNGHSHSSPEQESCSPDADHQAETVNQKHTRKKDSCSLATVKEETNGDGEPDDRYTLTDKMLADDKRWPRTGYDRLVLVKKHTIKYPNKKKDG